MSAEQDTQIAKISPRVLVGHRWSGPYKSNKYQSKNYTQTCDQYETDEGEEWGSYVLGYAEVEGGAMIQRKKDVAEFMAQVEEKAEDVVWKEETATRFMLQDIMYDIWSRQTDIERDELLNKTTERYFDSDKQPIDSRDEVALLLENEFENMFTSYEVGE